MNTEEMKLAKFEYIISGIAKELHCTAYRNLDKRYKSPLEFVISRKTENKFAEIIMCNAYIPDVNCGVGVEIELKDINFQGFVDKMVSSKKCYRIEYIFWLLMIMAVDNENYNENLNLIADTAFMMKIAEYTLKDCIKVVKAILNGETLSDIEYYDQNVKSCFAYIRV